MISLGVIGATVFFLPGILYLLLINLDTTPALQSREMEGSSSLLAIGIIALTSVLSHILVIAMLTLISFLLDAVNAPTLHWDFGLLKTGKDNTITVQQVFFSLLYATATCATAACFTKVKNESEPELNTENVKLASLCRAQKDDENLLLVAYVYFKTRRGNEDNPVSGLVGGVSGLRLDVSGNVKTITLLEPIPFIQFIDEDSLEADILEYGETDRYQNDANTNILTRPLTEIGHDQISHIVYAIHDKEQRVNGKRANPSPTPAIKAATELEAKTKPKTKKKLKAKRKSTTKNPK